MYQNAVIANDLFQHTVLLSLEILDLWARVNLIESFRKDDGRTRGRHSSTKIDLRMHDPLSSCPGQNPQQNFADFSSGSTDQSAFL